MSVSNPAKKHSILERFPFTDNDGLTEQALQAEFANLQVRLGLGAQLQLVPLAETYAAQLFLITSKFWEVRKAMAFKTENQTILDKIADDDLPSIREIYFEKTSNILRIDAEFDSSDPRFDALIQNPNVPLHRRLHCASQVSEKAAIDVVAQSSCEPELIDALYDKHPLEALVASNRNTDETTLILIARNTESLFVLGLILQRWEKTFGLIWSVLTALLNFPDSAARNSLIAKVLHERKLEFKFDGIEKEAIDVYLIADDGSKFSQPHRFRLNRLDHLLVTAICANKFFLDSTKTSLENLRRFSSWAVKNNKGFVGYVAEALCFTDREAPARQMRPSLDFLGSLTRCRNLGYSEKATLISTGLKFWSEHIEEFEQNYEYIPLNSATLSLECWMQLAQIRNHDFESFGFFLEREYQSYLCCETFSDFEVRHALEDFGFTLDEIWNSYVRFLYKSDQIPKDYLAIHADDIAAEIAAFSEEAGLGHAEETMGSEAPGNENYWDWRTQQGAVSQADFDQDNFDDWFWLDWQREFRSSADVYFAAFES